LLGRREVHQLLEPGEEDGNENPKKHANFEGGASRETHRDKKKRVNTKRERGDRIAFDTQRGKCSG